MNFDLTEQQRMVQDMARKFAEKEIAPYVEQDEENHYYRREILTKMGEMGLLGWSMPEEYGGNGMGWMEGVLALYEIAKVHTAWRIGISGNNWGPAMTINKFGTKEQKKKYIPGLLSGEYLGSFAMTEANIGSDVSGMKAFAEDKGDHYVLNGTKMWITGGQFSEVGLVMALTTKGMGAKGISCFILDYKNTPTGITKNPIHTKFGLLASPTAEMVFEDTIIPKENLLGSLNQGFPICMWMLNNTRMGSATGSVALSSACLEGSVKYANERIQFGQPIGKFQMIQEQIAQMKMEDEAAKYFIWHAAWLKDKGLPSQQAVSMAKLYGCQAAVHAANMAMKIYGSYGYSTEYPCPRWLRDAKQFEIVEGASNIHNMLIASMELGYQPNRA